METNYSVVLTVYEKENPAYFNLSILSILNQTKKTNDLVIVCDGPLTKELDQIIDKYKDRKEIHVLRLPESFDC